MASKTLEGKSLQIKIDLPNSPMFSTTNVSRYTVLYNIRFLGHLLGTIRIIFAIGIFFSATIVIVNYYASSLITCTYACCSYSLLK